MIVVVGVSHRAAPIEVRERLALSREDGSTLLRELTSAGPVREAMLVSTCNRVELIAAGGSLAEESLYEVASRCQGELVSRCPEAAPYVYKHVGGTAVRHLLRVAASLDSLVLGEPQILGQVKQAFERAQKDGTVGSALHRVVPRALRAAKRVRSETTIGSGQVSVPTVAVDVARQIFMDLSGRTALLIGSGEMGRSVARLLHGAGSAVLVLGRNQSKVAALASEVGGEPRGFEDLAASLTEADVVITSTSAPGYVVDATLVSRIRKARRGRSLFLIDLAVPRDVDPKVQELDGTFLYNIDDFSKTVAESLASRQREREAAERIIDSAARGYERWAEAEQVTPVIKALRKRFTSVLTAEVDKSLRGKLKHLDSEHRAALQKMVDAAIKKMLHEPSNVLRSMASAREKDVDGFVESAVEVLERLFSLDLDETASGAQSDPDGSEPDSDQPSGPEAADAPREDAAPSNGR